MDPVAILGLIADLYKQLSGANAALEARNQQWSDPEALKARLEELPLPTPASEKSKP